MGVITLLLIHEYSFFKEQATHLQELQQEYHTYLFSVKKALAQMNNDQQMVVEKKNELTQAMNLESDDQEEGEGEATFVVVNRDPRYLKESTVEYLRQENMEFLLSQIDFDDLAVYTDQLLDQQNKQTNKRKAPARARMKRPASGHQIYSGKPQVTDISLLWPIEKGNFWLSSFFGPRKKPGGKWGFHYGIDMAAVRGTSVKVAAAGVVAEARYSDKGYGKTIVVEHDKKYRTRYAHLDKILVHVGQQVARGQLIGKVGNTGLVRSRRGRDGGSHLHFEVCRYGKHTNPMHYLA
jgi:murein DD-endopeptidase MepM/ murein hydrolase activator NlpD